ncbi:RNA-binding domain-containing protein [Sodiomyces alkalinus F11]|uniref:RNA-binding domain-containing protein n=1 Tax=Sodiomyces alkalinus (strain CBS 110278 / VKM F-3762 / F11) TaxID=1314773 RepID=A0A3N2PK93_SODAK|nr:RNA-binding domain-containing protein [Sodiomyces alkalinus F11]ROT34814.1 RNA-binding domain-containing protein [Sodiomyces alkalinus F11]
MASTSMDYEGANGDRYEDETHRYDRDNRSASPRPLRDEPEGGRRRSASPPGNGDHVSKDDAASKGGDDDGAVNPGSNLFVTGIHPRLSESEVTRLFEKYGEVEKCQIMRDPHTKESRGFGFVKMVTSDQADAAKEGLQGEQIDGRTLSIEKARRARPRTPTPGKYFGPPKRDGRGGRFNDRYRDERRGGYGGGSGYYGRDDPYRYRGGGGGGGSGNDRRYDDRGGYREDRGYDRTYRDDRGGYGREREEGYGRVDRYGSGREDRYREDRYRDDRRGGPGYERDRYERTAERDAPRTRDAPSSGAGYGDSAAGRSEGREPYGSGLSCK